MVKLFFSINRNSILCKGDNFRRASGFTLIEVLVSMVILAIGLLGLASLQALALKNNKDAYLFSQASLLAYEMGDRIKANQAYWGPQFNPLNPTVQLPYNSEPVPGNGNSCNDPNQTCSPAQIAAYDYFYWQNSVQNALPAPTSGVPAAQILMSAAVGISPCTTVTVFPAQPAICLILTWQRGDQSHAADMLTNDATYRLEVTP